MSLFYLFEQNLRIAIVRDTLNSFPRHPLFDLSSIHVLATGPRCLWNSGNILSMPDASLVKVVENYVFSCNVPFALVLYGLMLCPLCSA